MQHHISYLLFFFPSLLSVNMIFFLKVQITFGRLSFPSFFHCSTSSLFSADLCSGLGLSNLHLKVYGEDDLGTTMTCITSDWSDWSPGL